MKGAQIVGMAEVKVCGEPGEALIALGLGSCVAICAYDAQANIAGMAHVILPLSAGTEPVERPGKFADTAVPLLLAEMVRAGAELPHIAIALCGGAQIFTGAGIGRGLNIGPRNALAVQEAIAQNNACLLASDLGGSSGRTVHLFTNGLVQVKTLGQGERPLVDLGRS